MKPVSRAVGPEEWLAFDKHHPAPIFHARPPWALALASLNPNMLPEPLHVTLDNATKVMIPLIRVAGGRLPWKVYVGMPWGCHSVVLREDGEAAGAEATERALSRLVESGISRLELNLWPFAASRYPRGFTSTTSETSVIDLADGIEVALRRMHPNTRKKEGQALRRGVTCRRENDSAAVSTYYDLYKQAASRWHNRWPVVPKRFIEALVHYGGDDVDVWIARHDGEAIAASIVLYGAQEATGFSLVRRHDIPVLNPHTLLCITIVRRVIERGLHWYNLGGSADMPGLLQFKSQLGSISVNYTSNVYESRPYAVYRLARKAISRAQKGELGLDVQQKAPT